MQTLIYRAFFITSIIIFCNLRILAQHAAHQVSFENGYIAYEDVQGDEVVLNVRIENHLQRKISIFILDISGDKIFKRSFTEKTISKKFRIPSGTGPVTFVISDPAGKKDQQFKIITNQRYVGEFSVKRVM